eukprot:377961_1
MVILFLVTALVSIQYHINDATVAAIPRLARLVLSQHQQMSYYRSYTVWNADQQTMSYLKIIESFNRNVIKHDIVLPSPLLLGPVLEACYALDDHAFADKAWNYITSTHPINCRVKPNSLLYTKLLVVYASSRSMDINKCIHLANQWFIQYQTHKQSLETGRPTGFVPAYNYAAFPNQIMDVILHKSDCEISDKKGDRKCTR